MVRVAACWAGGILRQYRLKKKKLWAKDFSPERHWTRSFKTHSPLLSYRGIRNYEREDIVLLLARPWRKEDRKYIFKKFVSVQYSNLKHIFSKREQFSLRVCSNTLNSLLRPSKNNKNEEKFWQIYFRCIKSVMRRRWGHSKLKSVQLKVKLFRAGSGYFQICVAGI